MQSSISPEPGLPAGPRFRSGPAAHLDLAGPGRRSCLALHRTGFALTRRVTATPVRSYRTISPLPVRGSRDGRAIGRVFLWHFPAAFAGSALPTVLALWCPDFPREAHLPRLHGLRRSSVGAARPGTSRAGSRGHARSRSRSPARAARRPRCRPAVPREPRPAQLSSEPQHSQPAGVIEPPQTGHPARSSTERSSHARRTRSSSVDLSVARRAWAPNASSAAARRHRRRDPVSRAALTRPS